MFIFTLQSSQLSVCVFKINRPCDEQPVPRWKYILWNTTVVCRKRAKHWLGSIELQLDYTAKQQEENTLSLPFQKMSLLSASLSALQPHRHKSSLSFFLFSKKKKHTISPLGKLLNQSCNALNRLPQFAVCAVNCTAQSQQPLKTRFLSLF